ncbi:MAG: hypothetical protein QXF17_04310 [Ignisphaera sp.]
MSPASEGTVSLATAASSSSPTLFATTPPATKAFKIFDRSLVGDLIPMESALVTRNELLALADGGGWLGLGLAATTSKDLVPKLLIINPYSVPIIVRVFDRRNFNVVSKAQKQERQVEQITVDTELTSFTIDPYSNITALVIQSVDFANILNIHALYVTVIAASQLQSTDITKNVKIYLFI